MKYDMTRTEEREWYNYLDEQLDKKQKEASWLDFLETLTEAKAYRADYLVKMFNQRDGVDFYIACVEIFRDYYADILKEEQYDWLMEYRESNLKVTHECRN